MCVRRDIPRPSSGAEGSPNGVKSQTTGPLVDNAGLLLTTGKVVSVGVYYLRSTSGRGEGVETDRIILIEFLEYVYSVEPANNWQTERI